MQEKNEKKPSFWAKLALSPFVQGPVLGASVMTLVTPLLKWTNHVYKGERMSFANPMSGAVAYATSAVPGYATTFVFKSLFQKPQEETNKQYDLVTSFVAGGASGVVCTPFEALAQNKQLTDNPSSKHTAKKMFNHNGYKAFFQGGASIAMREGLWSMVYLSAIPLMEEALLERGMAKEQAKLYSVVSVAGAYGFFSAPLNQLRFRKQQGLTEVLNQKSYLEHAKDIFNQDPKASSFHRMGSFFKASVPRAITTTVAGGLVVEGKKLYEETVNTFS